MRLREPENWIIRILFTLLITAIIWANLAWSRAKAADSTIFSSHYIRKKFIARSPNQFGHKRCRHRLDMGWTNVPPADKLIF